MCLGFWVNKTFVDNSVNIHKLRLILLNIVNNIYKKIYSFNDIKNVQIERKVDEKIEANNKV